MIRRLGALALSFTLIGCSSLYPKAYEPAKPLEINRTIIGSPLRQDGVALDPMATARAVGRTPEAKPHIDKYFYYNGAGIVIQVVSVVLFLDGLHNGRSQNVLIGLGGVGLGLASDYLGHRELKSAVQIHNDRLPKADASQPQSRIIVTPVFGVAQQGLLTGLRLEF